MNSSGQDLKFTAVDPNFEDRVKSSFSKQAFMSHIGAELVKISPGFCEIHLAYRKELTQQHGYFHAGIIGTIADNAGGYAAYSLMPADSSVLAVEYKLNLMSPGNGELLIGRGYVMKSGRTLSICRAELFMIKNGVEKMCATSLNTLIAMVGKPDKPVG